jgi:hypothetical protein
VTTKLFGPPINKELLKMAKEMKKTERKKGKSPVNMEYFNKCLKEVQSSHLVKKGSRPVNFQPQNSTPLNRVGSTPLNFKYNQYVKKRPDKRNTTPNSKCSSPSIENTFNDTEQTKVKQLIDSTETIFQDTLSNNDNCQILNDYSENLEVISNISEDCEVQSISGQSVTQDIAALSSPKSSSEAVPIQNKYEEEMKVKYEKCIRENQNLVSEIEIVKKSMIELKTKYAQETNTVKTKCNDLNAEILILQEEMGKLKLANSSLKQENKTLRQKMSTQQENKENSTAIQNDIAEINSKILDISQTLDVLKDRTENIPTNTDIYLLQGEVRNYRKEVNHNKQEEKSLETQAIVANSISKPDNKEEPPIIIEENKYEEKLEQHQASKPVEKKELPITIEDCDSRSRIFILGDSVTKKLKSKRMSTNRTSVNIRSYGGAEVKDICTKIPKLSEDSPDFSNSEIYVIHAGINNISNNVSPSDMKDQFQELTKSLTEKNPEAKIAISSILPMKSDTTSTDEIINANKQLRQLCDQCDYTYIDNTTMFMNNGIAKQELFTTEVHLSDKGAAVLAKNMKATIRSLLGIKVQSSHKQSGNFHWANYPQKSPGPPHQKMFYNHQMQKLPPTPHSLRIWNQFPPMSPWMYLFPPSMPPHQV